MTFILATFPYVVCQTITYMSFFRDGHVHDGEFESRHLATQLRTDREHAKSVFDRVNDRTSIQRTGGGKIQLRHDGDAGHAGVVT